MDDGYANCEKCRKRYSLYDGNCSYCEAQKENADLRAQLEAAKLRVAVLEVQRDFETIANTKTMFRGAEIIKRYEAAEAENAKLRAALKALLSETQDEVDYSGLPQVTEAQVMAKAALVVGEAI